MDQLKKNLGIGFFFVLVPLGLLWAWWPKEKEALPADNGFEDFLTAARLVADARTSLAPFAAGGSFLSRAENAEAWKLAQRGLAKTTRLPLARLEEDPRLVSDYFRGLLYLSFGIEQVIQHEFRSLGHTNEARALLLDALRLAHEPYRGGMAAHMANAANIESRFLRHANDMLVKADATSAREICKTLAALDEKMETPATMWGRQAMFASRTNIWQLVTPDAIYHSVRTDLKPVKEGFFRTMNGSARQRRKILVDAAARLHELEVGKRPASFADLVPKYLKAAPKDPETGKELNYTF